jgi:hypothetical protein
MKINPLIGIFLWACGVPLFGQHYNYAPNTPNIPLVQQRGDLAFGICWGHGTGSLELQAAYSPLKRMVVTANYFGARRGEVRRQQNAGTDFLMGELAIGFCEPVKKGTASLLAGFGGGRIFSNYEMNNSAELNLQRWFVQPGYIYQSEFFEAAAAFRFSRLHYSQGSISFSIDPNDLAYIRNIEAKTPILLPELGLQAGIVYRPLYLGIAVSSIIQNTSLWDFSRLNAALVLRIRHKGLAGRHESTRRHKGAKAQSFMWRPSATST